MSKLRFEITMTLDGYVAGPNPGPEQPLGAGGDRIHEWLYGLKSFREAHGESGGETGPEDDLLRESFQSPGAMIMGRGMFGGGPGPWGEDPWPGHWGDDPPFRRPVFVLTHHAREPLTLGETTFTFVSDGIESALEQARAVAAGQGVYVSGGADVAQQYLNAGLIDEMNIHVAPLLLGGGTRLFEDHGEALVGLECTRVLESPKATHLSYRVLR